MNVAWVLLGPLCALFLSGVRCVDVVSEAAMDPDGPGDFGMVLAQIVQMCVLFSILMVLVGI